MCVLGTQPLGVRTVVNLCFDQRLLGWREQMLLGARYGVGALGAAHKSHLLADAARDERLVCVGARHVGWRANTRVDAARSSLRCLHDNGRSHNTKTKTWRNQATATSRASAGAHLARVDGVSGYLVHSLAWLRKCVLSIVIRMLCMACRFRSPTPSAVSASSNWRYSSRSWPWCVAPKSSWPHSWKTRCARAVAHASSNSTMATDMLSLLMLCCSDTRAGTAPPKRRKGRNSIFENKPRLRWRSWSYCCCSACYFALTVCFVFSSFRILRLELCFFLAQDLCQHLPSSADCYFENFVGVSLSFDGAGRVSGPRFTQVSGLLCGQGALWHSLVVFLSNVGWLCAPVLSAFLLLAISHILNRWLWIASVVQSVCVSGRARTHAPTPVSSISAFVVDFSSPFFSLAFESRRFNQRHCDVVAAVWLLWPFLDFVCVFFLL